MFDEQNVASEETSIELLDVSYEIFKKILEVKYRAFNKNSSVIAEMSQ
jgi:hypothetical protein